MCKAHYDSKVTHIKHQKYFHHLKGRGYSKNSVLYPGRFRWWKYICCFICVTLLWALHIVIKQQFFTFIWVRGHSRSLKMVLFERLDAVSYLPSIVTQYVRCGRLTSTPVTVISGVPQGVGPRTDSVPAVHSWPVATDRATQSTSTCIRRRHADLRLLPTVCYFSTSRADVCVLRWSCIVDA